MLNWFSDYTLQNLFSSKYPTENLHEMDLSWIIKTVGEMVNILESWRSTIEELEAGLQELNSINDRLDVVEEKIAILDSLQLQINSLIAEISALSIDNLSIHDDITRINQRINSILDGWNELFNAFKTVVKSEIKAEELERKQGDLDLNIKINALKYQVEKDVSDIYDYINEHLAVTIYNPGCGKRLNPDKNTRKTYEHLRDRGVTIGEMLQRHVMVSDIADKYRCFRLACKGRDIFKYTRHLYSPGTGRLESYHQIYSDIIGEIRGSDTIDNVINAALSISDLLALNKTCRELQSYEF